MALNVVNHDGVITIELSQKFDFDSVDEFRRAYESIDSKSCVVDFRNTDYMDSSGLGMLLNMRRSMGEGASPIKLINCRPQIKKIFVISKFESKFEIY